MTPLKIAILGCGGRGNSIGCALHGFPHLATIVAVADPDSGKAQQLGDKLGVPASGRFAGWKEFLASGMQVDGAVIATMDQDHVEPAEACLARGWHLILEKPMAPNMGDCRRIEAAQRKAGTMVSVCHSLRYQKAFRHVRDLLRQGVIGRIMSIDLLEQVGFWHQAHSFVRGNWGNSGRSAPMILAKSCHDMDYLAFLVGAPAERVSSYGHLSYFTKANTPKGAPARCTDGCPHEGTCTFSALKRYVYTDNRAEWPASVCSPTDHSLAAHFKAVQTGPYGRCVWQCDNDVVDHQVIAMEFPGEVTATFTMTAFTHEGGRRLRVHGTEAVLEFIDHAQEITITTFATGNVQKIAVGREQGGHGGGDTRMARDWLDAIHAKDPSRLVTTPQESLGTHAMAFAAEQSRLERRPVEIASLLGK
jgi:predicted dehydrogenase